jgi:hypothetical protein
MLQCARKWGRYQVFCEEWREKSGVKGELCLLFHAVRIDFEIVLSVFWGVISVFILLAESLDSKISFCVSARTFFRMIRQRIGFGVRNVHDISKFFGGRRQELTCFYPIFTYLLIYLNGFRLGFTSLFSTITSPQPLLKEIFYDDYFFGYD